MHHLILLGVPTAAMLLGGGLPKGAAAVALQTSPVLNVGVSITCYMSFRHRADRLKTPRHVLW